MMNNKLYKKLVIAMMITTISAVAAASAADTTASVRPVDLAQAESIQARAKAEQQEIKAEKAQQRKAARAEAKAKKAADAVRPVDITPELREELAQKIADDAAKSAERQLTSGQRIRKSIRSSSSAAYRPMALSI